MSDISKDFERYDIFTRKDAISGFKSCPWAGLSKLVNIPLDSSIFAVRYHNLHYWFYDSIYIAVTCNLALRTGMDNITGFLSIWFLPISWSYMKS